LCQQGVICHLVPHNLYEQEIWALAPDFVLLNFFRLGNQDLGRKLAGAGIQVGVLDTEGGVFRNEAAYVETLWKDAGVRRQLQCVCIWGPRLAQHLVAQGLLSPEQVAVTGCPRFDFYHPRWQPALGEPGKRARSRILINTNFSTSNPRFATLAEHLRHGIEVEGLPHERVVALFEAEHQAIEAMIRLAQDLARDYSSAEIVLRPHPFENVDVYRRRLNGLGRIIVDNEGPIQPEICRASVVIQRGCTTAIEAGLAGVPALSPQWVPAPVVHPMAEMVSVPCEAYGDLRARLDAIFSGTYGAPGEIRSAIDCVTRDWFFRADGLAHRRVSDAVLARLGGSRIVDERRCERLLYGLNGAAGVTAVDLGCALRYRLRLPPDWSFRQLRRVPTQNKPGKSFGVADVRALTDRIQRIEAAHGARPVTVTAASAHPHYQRRLSIHSVTLGCEW
jgi:surface carbohydrate biosynthesis protein